MFRKAVDTKHEWRSKTASAVAVLLALGSLGSVAPASAETTEVSDGAQIDAGRWHDCAHGPEGSWFYTVDIQGFTFHGTETYAGGGGYIEADELGQMPGSLATPGHGVWKIIGQRKFLLTYVNLTHDADGTPSGTSKVRQTTTISPSCDFYSGSGDYAYYNPDGTPGSGGSGTFTITATRIKVEAP